jgi:hypothetical protein
LGIPVEPLRITAELSQFLDTDTPGVWHNVCEHDEVSNQTYDNMTAEYICGALFTHTPGILELITAAGPAGTVDMNDKYAMQWVCPELDLIAKYRKDGLHMRTAPPERPNSRKVWHLTSGLLTSAAPITSDLSTASSYIKRNTKIKAKVSCD